MKAGIVLALTAAAVLPAQTREERGKQTVQQAIQALGGPAFLAMRDRVEAGRVYSFYREQLAGLAKAIIYTRYLTAPDPPKRDELYSRERTSFGTKDRKDKEDYATLFDEEKGYQITYRGARPLPAPLLARYRDTTRRNVFYILKHRLNEPGMLIEFEAVEVFENQPVNTVTFTDSENVTVTVMFHQTTKLPLRQIFIRRDPQTRERNEEVTRFDKYRDAGDGVLWPYVIQRERNGSRIFEIFSESVKVNQDLTDDLFTLSGDMKVLPPSR